MQGGRGVLPFPFCQFFEVHGSKFKLHPVRYLSQASVLCITHSVFLFCVRKDPFNRFFALLIQIAVLRRIPGIIRQIFVVLPDMPLYRFCAVFGMCTQSPRGTIGADFRIAFVLAAAIPVCCAVVQDLVFRADHAVIEFIINVFPPFVSALHGLRPFVGCRKNPLVPKHLFADMRRLVSTVCNHSFYFRKPLRHLVIYFVKGNAVMDIAWSHDRFQHKAILVTGGMSFIGKLAFVAAFYKESTVGVSYAFCH